MPPAVEPVVRNAVAGDARHIEELYRQLVNNPAVNVVPERISAISDDPNTRLFVCEYQGEVQGSALVSICADVMFGTQPFAVVENLVVDTDMQNQGLGAALLRHIEAFCRATDCSKIMLLSSIQRERAHRFFERSGFVGSSKRGFVKYRSAFSADSPFAPSK